MTKYYILLLAIIGSVLIYIFLQDPCNEQFRADFSQKYPDYKILDFGGEGDIENVYCHVFYQKTDGDQIYEDVWKYQRADDDWQFIEIQETNKRDDVSRDF
jgi:hypothetical protein